MSEPELGRQAAGVAVPWPSARAGWTLVVLLTVAYVFSFVDRYILGLLIEPIKADLGLTDEQIGWVIGPAFAVFYATMGLPLGWLVDRKRRAWIVAAGIAVWSLATAASGLATKFWHLFAARMLVGAGEATLSPAAFSMIGDSFPPEKRGKPVAFYSMALTLGAGIASLIGGAVLVWAKSTQSVDLGAVGTIKPWQLTFFAVGLPGLVVAAFFMVIAEPPRRTTTEVTPDLAGNSFRDAMGYTARHWKPYLGFVSLVCVMTIIAYSQGFLPSVFERTWDWPREQYAFANGIALLAIGPVTVFAAGWLSDRMSQNGRLDAPFRLLAIGYVIMFASGFGPYFIEQGWLAFALLCINTVGIATVSAVGVTSLLLITPAPIRGQIVALYYVVISMTGLLLGPTTVGSLSTRVFGEEEIRYAMASVVLLYGTIPLMLIPIVGRLFRKQMKELSGDTE
ncbi:MFS transporter [Altererythrobacter sp. GH1-8]|uniref:MFS transporter n=1 Tax=Altererythrobacter sp. GH1-8 TaxID=3349333 RepID=UPI00374D03DA